MYYHIIASGSKGNATLVGYKSTLLLIDFGISVKRLKEGLSEINKTFEDIDGVLFSHEHADHMSGAKYCSPSLIYGLRKTVTSLANFLYVNEARRIKDIVVTPFAVSHDALNPCGFLLQSQNESLVYLTDSGYFNEDNLPLIKNPTYLIIESNHDLKLLYQSNRPLELKNRIHSSFGHLSNEDSAFASYLIVGNKTKDIVLSHISQECNTLDLALSAYQKVFNFKGGDLFKYNIRFAKQNESLSGGNINED